MQVNQWPHLGGAALCDFSEVRTENGARRGTLLINRKKIMARMRQQFHLLNNVHLVPSQAREDRRKEMLWMSLYFSAGVWVGLGGIFV